MCFSVLMSVYYKEKPIFLNQALTSIYDNQTLKPSQIVLIEDGNLTSELYEIIKIWKNKLGEVLTIIPIEQNVGLGKALEIGINNCKFEYIARMDSDDISASNRFEKQLEVFKNNDIDICGGWVSEFEGDEKNIYAHRKVPEFHDDIIKFAKFRSPINHPSVMYKKTAVLNAGNYKTMYLFEDYYLWIRMILNGAKFYNIQEPLVNMRAGIGQLKRRHGLRYAIKEYKIQKEFYNLGFLNKYEFIKNIILKFIARLLPKTFLAKIYSKIRK